MAFASPESVPSSELSGEIIASGSLSGPHATAPHGDWGGGGQGLGFEIPSKDMFPPASSTEGRKRKDGAWLVTLVVGGIGLHRTSFRGKGSGIMTC